MTYPVGYNITNDTKYINLVKPVLLKLLKESFPHKSNKIDIWVKGSSGAILGGMLATHLPEDRVTIKHIKKSGESSHHNNLSLYGFNERVNIIIDDFIESGKTINSINDELKNKGVSCDILIIANTMFIERLNFQPDYVITTQS